MSTERLSFGFNSLIPETYKTKAEAFARCLQHKLLSLGRVDASSDSYSSESKKRLTDDVEPKESPFATETTSKFRLEEKPRSQTSQKSEKTEDSEEEICSHSESENGDFGVKQKEGGGKRTMQKLTSVSSEDSTVESWSSCQENLTDVEKFDSENEDINYFAAQIKGSPKLRTFNIRCKRKEMKERPWRRNSRRNHSSSTESVDSEGRGGSRQSGSNIENFDAESHNQYILLDGLEDEEEEVRVPHRILRESSSTSNLERHFSRSFDDDFEVERRFKPERKEKNESEMSNQLITPPPSPDLQKFCTGEEQDSVEATEPTPRTEDVAARLVYAEAADEEDVEFDQVERMKDFTIDDVSRSVKKIGGVIVECFDESQRTSDDRQELKTWEDFTVTCVEVHQDDGEEEEEESKETEEEEVRICEKISEDDESIEHAEDEELLSARSKLRRCSSLKTWKTPPGTPGAKKIVRFADALGLDLADVRTFLDEIPKVPSSAYEDLHFDFSSESDPPPPPVAVTTLIPLFQQPGTKMDFLEKVQLQKICLEAALVTDTCVLTVTGYVRVQNLSFHKSVHVRYSLNNWQTFSDLQATYVPNSCDGFSDKFSFVLYGHTLKIGEKLEFALRLDSSGSQFWDNNGGINYVFNCLPQTSANSFFPSSSVDQNDPWFNFY